MNGDIVGGEMRPDFLHLPSVVLTSPVNVAMWGKSVRSSGSSVFISQKPHKSQESLVCPRSHTKASWDLPVSPSDHRVTKS